MQATLHGDGGLVMQQAGDPVIVYKNKLAGKAQKVRMDSFIPRRLSTIKTTINVSPAEILKGCAEMGSRLTSASTPLAIEIAMVNT